MTVKDQRSKQSVDLLRVLSSLPEDELSNRPRPVLVELASGVDAIYSSGRASLPFELVARLEAARADAVARKERVTFEFGGTEVLMAPHAFGRYHFCLIHQYGRIGITTSPVLPTFRIQPLAEFLHGSGPRAATAWFHSLLEEERHLVQLSVSRIDLFADFQGWILDVDDRKSFVFRSDDLATHETSGGFNGLRFGRRGAGAISARIYDKTIELQKSGSIYWIDIWGEAFIPGQPVLRVEFELGASTLRQFDLVGPEETLDAAGSLWGYLTSSWTSHRVPSEDKTRSRWPESPEWAYVRRASIGENDWGITRVYAAKRKASLSRIMPGLVGYLASYGALINATSFAELVVELGGEIPWYGVDTGETFEERIQRKRKGFGLP